MESGRVCSDFALFALFTSTAFVDCGSVTEESVHDGDSYW